MKTLCLRGRVHSGKGEGAAFVNLPWTRKQIEEKFGFTPYSGTLNIKLDRNSIRTRKALMNRRGGETLSDPGFCRGRIFDATMMSVKCAVVVPEVPGYQEDVLEVVSSTNLRERLNLVDGSSVEVQVMF